MMTENEIRYALAKQVGTMRSIGTDYGSIELDDELTAVLEPVLRGALRARRAATRTGYQGEDLLSQEERDD